MGTLCLSSSLRVAVTLSPKFLFNKNHVQVAADDAAEEIGPGHGRLA